MWAVSLHRTGYQPMLRLYNFYFRSLSVPTHSAFSYFMHTNIEWELYIRATTCCLINFGWCDI